MNDNELKNFWDLCLSDIAGELDDEIAYNSFYKDSSIGLIDNGEATIVVDSDLKKLILGSNLEMISKVMSKVAAQDISCHIILNSELLKPSEVPITQSYVMSDDNINPLLSFETFVVGISNREAHSASLAIAMNPGGFYNPLFVYGNSGLGKTHLLNSIGNYIKDKKKGLNVVLLPSEQFVNDYISATKLNKMDSFNNKYYNADVLLVDDIQFLAGKEKNQEAFFHIFNHLVNNKKQIVLTSDRHPESLDKLENRLVSRFSSGLSVGIDTPEFETSLAILKKKIELRNVNLELIEPDVLNYIASKFSSDVRRLEGAVNRILFYSISFNTGQIIDMKLALEAFTDYEGMSTNENLSTEKIKKIVASYYHLSTYQLTSKSRTNAIAVARHIAIYLCRELLDISYVKIGEEFGNRDHSTIMSACDKVKNLVATDDNYKKALKELESILKS